MQLNHSYLAMVLLVSLAACSMTPRYRPAPDPYANASTCPSFMFAGECVRTRMGQSEWLNALRKNPKHIECTQGVWAMRGPLGDGFLDCEALMTVNDRNLEAIHNLGSIGGGGHIPIPGEAPAAIIIFPSGY